MTIAIEQAGLGDRHKARTDVNVIGTEYGVVRITSFHPSIHMSYSEESSQKPVVLSHGWAESQDATHRFAESVALGGRTMITFGYPSFKSRRALPDDIQVYRASILDAVVESLEEPGGVDMLAHSEGSFAALSVSQQRDVSSLLLAAPAGLSGIENPRRLVERGAKEGAYGFYKNTSILGAIGLARAGINMANHFGRNARLSVAEVTSIAKTDAKADLLRLISQNRTHIGVVACRYDKLFPPAMIEAHVGTALDDVDYRIVDTNHFRFLVDKSVQKALIHALNDLDHV